MAETVEKPDRDIRELVKGMKEGAEDMLDVDTRASDESIRDRIQRLKEDL